MLKDELPIFDITLDPEFSDNGEYLGVDRISNVASPAVRIKGFAFSDQSNKKQFFTDSKKYRIVAPALVPGTIYRNDEEGEYFVKFTPEIIEEMAKKFMMDLPKIKIGVFNTEHVEHTISDSYILEAILVDSESKVKMIKDAYGIVVPLGSFVLVQQFNNKLEYEDIVAKGQTGFSIEGFLGMKLPETFTNKQKFNVMKNKKNFVGTKRTFKSASKLKMAEVVKTDDLILVAEELAVGKPVMVVEDVLAGPISDFTGEIETKSADGSKDIVVIVEAGMITEIVFEDTVAETIEEPVMVDEAVVETEMADEVIEPVIEPVVETVAEPVTEVVAPVEDVNAKIAEIYDMIAEIKAELASMKADEVSEDMPVEMNKHKFAEVLKSFNTWTKGK